MTPMQFGTEIEIRLFLYSCLVGVLLSVVYAVLRSLRVLIKHHKAVVFVEDFAFGLFYGFCFFLTVTDLTNIVRMFMLVGMLIGSFAGDFFVGNLIVWIARIIKALLDRIIINPAVCLITKSVHFISNSFVKKYPKLRKNKKIDENSLKV